MGLHSLLLGQPYSFAMNSRLKCVRRYERRNRLVTTQLRDGRSCLLPPIREFVHFVSSLFLLRYTAVCHCANSAATAAATQMQHVSSATVMYRPCYYTWLRSTECAVDLVYSSAARPGCAVQNAQWTWSTPVLLDLAAQYRMRSGLGLLQSY
jgi:hypothetical protein